MSQRLEVPAGAYTIDDSQTATFLAPASLRSSVGGPSGLFFDVKQVFAIVGSRGAAVRQLLRAKTSMYQYRILDYNHRELLVYHWQPGQRFAGPDHPHMHVSATIDAHIDAVTRRDIGLDKRHLATGRVSLPAVVRMLITEFEIAPLRHDWRAILDRTETAVEQRETR